MNRHEVLIFGIACNSAAMGANAAAWFYEHKIESVCAGGFGLVVTSVLVMLSSRLADRK